MRLESAPDVAVDIFLREQPSSAISPATKGILHSGRVLPGAILNKTFGPAFVRLAHTESKALANALGGLARVWELLVADDKISPDVMSPDNKSNPASFGIGLINTLTNWFPELRPLSGRMERCLKTDNDAASELCESSITRLEPLCGCYICSATKGPPKSPENPPVDGFCLATLMGESPL